MEIAELTRLNLFVGENNAGKSCLLEAIRLWAGNATLQILRDLVHSRDGDWEANLARRHIAREGISVDVETEDPIRFLFNNFHYREDSSATIEVGPDDPDETIRISLGRYRTIASDDGTVRRVRVSGQLQLEGEEQDAEWMLEIVSASRRRFVYPLDILWRRSGVMRASPSEDSAVTPSTVVGTGGLSFSQAAFLWDQVSLTPQQDKVLDCLRLVEPGIEGLALVGDSARMAESDRIPVISLRGRRGRFPLKTMGDGLTRLFHIALAMVNAQNGLVLIDEFENGLYWEVQRQLWPLIFEMAHEFNVQVFATTHSNDCVSSFAQASLMSENSGSLFRIERLEKSVRVFSLPILNVADALAAQVEVR